MDSDSEDFVYVGTPLEQEEEQRGYRKKVTDLAVTKALPVHKQEATDAEGRRRFHGAFTGGFSAGYFNTVGSKEGWTPQQFTSTRANRGKVAQTAEDFMDDDEREEMRATALEARDDYDTFGTAAELRAQRAMAASEATGDGGRRKVIGPAIIPGPVPSDLVVPTSDPVGARLLLLMGWRRGKGIGRKGARDDSGAGGDDENGECNDENGGQGRRKSRWGASTTALVDDTPRYVLHPKTNLHGVGYDPFEGAEEFRKVAHARAKRANEDPRGLGSTRPERGEAFGVGVFEGDDPDEDVYRTRTLGGDLIGHTYEIMSEEEEESDGEDARRRARDATGKKRSGGGNEGDAARASAVRGFLLSADSLAPTKWYQPPTVPKSFRAFHVFPPGTEPPPIGGDASKTLASNVPRAPPPPPPVPPPTDAERAKFIDTTAMFVAKNGPAFEQMARERQRGDPKFSFLHGGPDEGYYRYKLGECRRELGAGTGAVSVWANMALGEARPRPLDADDRARMLGETPLPATMKGGGAARPLSAAPPPGTKVPEKQPEVINVKGIAAGDRSRIQANLGSMFTSGSTLETQDMGHGSRALKPGLTMASSFVSAGAVEDPKEAKERAERAKLAPILNSRVSGDWAPESLLCKRFDVRDPFEGRSKPGPVKSFKSDSIVLTETVAAASAAAPKFLGTQTRGEQNTQEVPQNTQEVPPPPPPPVAATSQASAMLPPPPRTQQSVPAQQSVPPPPRRDPGGNDLRRYSTGAWGSRPVAPPHSNDAPGPTPARGLTALMPEPSVKEEAESFLDGLGIVPERPMEFFKAIFDDSDDEDDPPPPRRTRRSPSPQRNRPSAMDNGVESRRPMEVHMTVSGPAPPPGGLPAAAGDKRSAARDEDDDERRFSKKAKKESKKESKKKSKKSKKEKKSKKSKRSRRDRSDSSSDSDS